MTTIEFKIKLEIEDGEYSRIQTMIRDEYKSLNNFIQTLAVSAELSMRQAILISWIEYQTKRDNE